MAAKRGLQFGVDNLITVLRDSAPLEFRTEEVLASLAIPFFRLLVGLPGPYARRQRSRRKTHTAFANRLHANEFASCTG